MPRHRLEERPRHRAKRQGFWPARGVRSDAAPAHAAQPGATSVDTAPLRKTISRPDYGRLIRSALLTPWFAVSVGIVVATSLTLAHPHPALTFPPSKIGHCQKAGCSSTSPRPLPPRAADKREARLPPRSGVKVEYQLFPKNKNHFMAVIVIASRKPLGRWSLGFVLPGAHIDRIIWAKWQRHGVYGVLVTGSPPLWARSGANEARLVLFGTGAPSSPTGCVFDHAVCKFGALSTDSPYPGGSRHRHGRKPHDR